MRAGFPGMVLFEDGVRDRSRVSERASASTDANTSMRAGLFPAWCLFDDGLRERGRVLPMCYATCIDHFVNKLSRSHVGS